MPPSGQHRQEGFYGHRGEDPGFRVRVAGGPGLGIGQAVELGDDQAAAEAGLARVAGGHAESVDFAASKSFTAKWIKDNHGEVYQLQLDGMREQVDLVKYAFDNAQEQKKLKTQITGNSTTSIFDGTARVKDTNMPYR